MLQSNAKIIPVFYQVRPSDLRHIETGVYAEAFIKYEKKSRNLEKLKEWKEALQSLSFIAGEEITSFSDCKSIVAAVQKEVHRNKCLHVATYPVGLDSLVKDFEKRCLDELVQDFENQCRLKKGKDKVKIVGIFGIGGVGKTTLAKELYNRKRFNYSRAGFLFDVREASVRSQLPSLQRKLVEDLFDDHPQSFTSTEEGTSYLKNKLERSPLLGFLIVVDDIDHVEQLHALLIMDILDKFDNTLVIVTTRDARVLINAGITVGYHLKGMNRNDGSQLFCWHAFGQPFPLSGYEGFVHAFVDVCGGLPLSLQVLGRHVRGGTASYWRLELDKAKKTLSREVKDRLRISFDALDGEQKEVFMDIACFFLDKPKIIAEQVWKGLGWNAQHALQRLMDKLLVEEIHIFNDDENYRYNEDQTKMEIVFRMHDHLRDLGREMALELSPPHRLWRPQDLKFLESMGFKKILAKTNVRCLHSIFDESMDSQITFFLGQLDICGETSASLPWLQLKGNSTELPNIPSWICLQNLQCLKIKCGRLETLWKNSMQVPTHLKELVISRTSLKEFPDFLGIPGSLENEGKFTSVKAPMSSLEKLEISFENLVSKILISGIHYPSLESIKFHGMERLKEMNLTGVQTLKCLDLTNCRKLKRLTGISDLSNLVWLNISGCPDLEFEYLCLRAMECLQRITFDRNVKMKYFELDGCRSLETTEFGFEKLVQLKIIIDGIGKIGCFHLDECQNLRSVSLNFDLTGLHIAKCPELEELPSLSRQRCLEWIRIDSCKKLRKITLSTTLNNISVTNCRDLQKVVGTGDLIKLTRLIIRECPRLEELPSLPRLSCLKEIEIDSCAKLKNISGVEELHVSKVMRLNYCSNTVIQNCIHKLKIFYEWKEITMDEMRVYCLSLQSALSFFTVLIGRAVDGAESTLNESLFSDATIDVDAVTRITTRETEWSKLSAIIGCFVQGKRIVTLGTSYKLVSNFVKFEDMLSMYGITNNGFWVEVKKDEEWKIALLLRLIVERLYDS
ncbi:disease resistance protein Roq1-like [Cryptomeria japonica]|uniref:disease resistance protein Roq1-like n=1 Tax=Cryptomeria japonica TaxID=3369 RepID=UPI0025ACBDB8|nr:disease resistance protein Roq1-like [Cryptomeria japonica]